MGQISTGATTIDFGTNLRIGWRQAYTDDAFTYLTEFPEYNDLPYVFELPAGVYEIEYTQVCPSCTISKYSDPSLAIVTVPT